MPPRPRAGADGRAPETCNQLARPLNQNGHATSRAAKLDSRLRVDPTSSLELIEATHRAAAEMTPEQSIHGGSSAPVSPPTSESEDYDALELDPAAIVNRSDRGSIRNTMRLPRVDTTRMSDVFGSDDDTAKPMRDGGPQHIRKGSVQIKLEKTDKNGQYVLTADNPEIREMLRRVIEREAAASLDPSQMPRTRFRDLVFTRQFTTFDRQNPLSSESPFHGFFTLFWLCLVMMFLRISAQNWKTYGSVIGNNEIMELMFSRDVVVLFLTDGIICSGTFFGFLLQRVILRGWLSWNRSGWILQNLWQTIYLASIIGWTMYREWPWTHTVFIVLHTMVLLMKQHSYSAYNGYLSQVYRRRELLQQHLHRLKEIEPIASPESTAASSLPTSPHIYSLDIPPDNSLRYRRRSVNAKSSTNLKAEDSEVANVAAAIESGQPLDAIQMQAFSRVIRSEIRALTEELKGKCTTGTNSYPHNLTISNFVDWTCLPTLVYELEYPRQERINWWYVAEKSAATFGVIGVMMVISQAYIYPAVVETVRMKEAGMPLQQRWKELPWVISDMLFPLLLEQLLSWYVIWECVLNVLAELTRFADRGFYGDWWNCVSWDQYARQWNRPVHAFLLRHVYHSSISAFHLSTQTATFVTFLLSACLHELLMLCLFKKLRGYLFAIQLLQLPLVSLSRTRLLKGRATLGNIVFWIGLFVGPSLVTALYLVV